MAFVGTPLLVRRVRTTQSRTENSCSITMKKNSSSPKGSKRPKDPPRAEPESTPIAPSPEEMLLKDIERIRAKEKDGPAKETAQSPFAIMKSVVDTLLLWDFFLVVGLLGWLAVALIPHFASKNEILLDPWLALWQPFIQPVLGVLMLGTVVQGTLSFITSKE